MSKQEDDTIREFIVESREHLASLEHDLLLLEREEGSVDTEVVRRVFRAVHSIKGGASFLSFGALSRIAHRMESVLDRLRSSQIHATPELVDVLLRGVDVLRSMIDDIGHSESVPCQKELDDLDQILAATASAPTTVGDNRAVEPATLAVQQTYAGSAAVSPGSEVSTSNVGDSSAAASESIASTTDTVLGEFGLEEYELSKLLARGMYLYQVMLPPSVAVNREALERTMRSVGSLLGKRSLTGDAELRWLCASVLEHGMFASAIGIEPHRARTIDTSALRERLRLAGVSGAHGHTRPLKSMPTLASEQGTSDDTLRVRVGLLDRLVNATGELVLGRNQLLRAFRDTGDVVPGLSVILQHLNRVTQELQDGVMQTRMQPVGSLLTHFPRVVRDLARQLGKQVVISIEGEGVELDKSVLELLADPLNHLIRNCVDHAIELPAERVRLGKSATGHINLRAFHQGGHVNVLVSDDGSGIDKKAILQRAIEKGVISKEQTRDLSDHEITQLVLAPGVSTAKQVSELSGRGVGLDVVRANVERLGGRIEIETEPNVGTNVLLSLPLTLAIVSSLIVRAGDVKFAIPQSSIEELVCVEPDQIAKRIEKLRGVAVLRLRGRLLPLVRLSDVLGIERQFIDPDTGSPRGDRRHNIADERSPGAKAVAQRTHWSASYSIAVVRAGSNRFGIIVDELLESEDIVVKPLPRFFASLRCFAGSTILGDGCVTMILDPSGVSQQANLTFGATVREELQTDEARARISAANDAGQRVVLFDNAPGERFAVPQDTVLRFERIASSDIQRVAGREFVKYRGAGLRVVRLSQALPVSPVPESATELFLIVPKIAADFQPLGQRGGAILVWTIVDARQIEVTLGETLFAGPGLLGAALVDDCLTTFIDPVRFLIESEPALGSHT